MNQAALALLRKRLPVNGTPDDHLILEVVQEIIQLGLLRSGFYGHGAIAGSAALRFFFGLPRFSETFELTLLKPDMKFDLEPHLKAIGHELSAFGIPLEIVAMGSRPGGTGHGAPTGLAQVRDGVKESWLRVATAWSTLTFKIEWDLRPAPALEAEVQFTTQPIAFTVKLLTGPTLLAGVVHALLRPIPDPPDPRMLHDFAWALSVGIGVDHRHLEERLRQSGLWHEPRKLNLVDIKQMLRSRFEEASFAASMMESDPKNESMKNLNSELNARSKAGMRSGAPVDPSTWSREYFVERLKRLTTNH